MTENTNYQLYLTQFPTTKCKLMFTDYLSHEHVVRPHQQPPLPSPTSPRSSKLFLPTTFSPTFPPQPLQKMQSCCIYSMLSIYELITEHFAFFCNNWIPSQNRAHMNIQKIYWHFCNSWYCAKYHAFNMTQACNKFIIMQACTKFPTMQSMQSVCLSHVSIVLFLQHAMVVCKKGH